MGGNLISNEKELATAIENNQDYIEIKGDLARKTIKIKAVGPIVWGVCLGAIAIAVVAILAAPATGGTSAALSAFAAPAAVATLGASATATAISLAVATGGVAVLNKLRDYDMEKISEDKIRLIRKKS